MQYRAWEASEDRQGLHRPPDRFLTACRLFATLPGKSHDLRY
jgi:hypothetical protein